MAAIADRKIDPVTGDFVDAPGGAFAQCDVLENQLAFSYSVPLGSWEGDPTIGHRLDELAREKNSLQVRKRAEALLKLAAKWLVDAGDLDHVDVTVEEFGPGGVAFEVDAYPAGGRPKLATKPFFIAFGGA